MGGWNRGKRWDPTAKEIASIEALAQYRLSDEKIAHVMGVSYTTFARACKKNTALRDGLLRGKAVGSAKVVQSAFEMATSKKHPALTIFWLKTQERWKVPPEQILFPDQNGDPQQISSSVGQVIVIPSNGRETGEE